MDNLEGKYIDSFDELRNALLNNFNKLEILLEGEWEKINESMPITIFKQIMAIRYINKENEKKYYNKELKKRKDNIQEITNKIKHLEEMKDREKNMLMFEEKFGELL